MSRPFRDLTGQRFGRLVCISRHSDRRSSGEMYARWSCVCDCGTHHDVDSRALTRGQSRSCGCLQRDRARETARKNATHGRSGTPEYYTWQKTLSRCYNTNDNAYSNYGGRGIRVCKRWKASFGAFLEDMGARPSSSHSIDRIDNSRGYSPDNCRWTDRKSQNRNARSNVLTPELAAEVRDIKEQGGNVAAWARIHGIKKNTAHRAAAGETWT